jgi:uncharacterized membrane protein
MWRSKKFIFIGVIVIAIVLTGTLGGVAIAQANDDSANQAQTAENTLMEKVAEIYQANTGTTIDVQQLKKAFEQAGQEIRSEARDNFLQKLVDEGKITQEQSDQFKAWLEAKPDIPSLLGQAGCGGMRFFGAMHNGKGEFSFKFGGGSN